MTDSLSTFRRRLQQKEPLLGTMITLALPQIPELLAQAGFDWLFIDGEHAPFGAAEVAMLVQAAGPCPCLVRTPSQSVQAIKNALDSGAAGVIAPLVNTADEAETVVQTAKYPPDGRRSVGVGRAHGYGMQFQAYIDRANEETVVVIQAEHVDAVHNIESIVAVPGVDCILLGPYDLSGSLGKPGQIDDPEVQEAIEHVRQACLDADVPLGIFSMGPDRLVHAHTRGFSLLALGLDTWFLGRGAVAAREALSRGIGRAE